LRGNITDDAEAGGDHDAALEAAAGEVPRTA
jgi:hypothetical protein